MSNTGRDLSLAPLSEPVRTDPHVIQKAIKNLETMFTNGELPQLPGWDLDVLEGWKDMLGLNGRPIRQRVPAGLKR